MLVLNGISASKQIRAMQHANNQVLIIAISAAVETEIKTLCQQCGMNDFLTKPFNKEQLLE